MVKLDIKLDNKIYYLLVLVLIVIVINGVVIAFTTDGSGDSTKMGHSLDEVELPSCTEGQVLKYTSGVWDCGTDNGGSSTLSCRIVKSTSVTGSSNVGYAECNSGEFAVGGGCSTIPSGNNIVDVQNLMPYKDSGTPLIHPNTGDVPRGWACNTAYSNFETFAVCCSLS